MAVTFPAVGSKRDGTQIQAPLLADRCMESSCGIAGYKLFLQTVEYCQQWREQDCFKGCTSYVILTNYLNIACTLIVFDSLPHRSNQLWWGVEQDQLYKVCSATAGLKACWQLTGLQSVATMGLNFPIFSVLIWKLSSWWIHLGVETVRV